MSDIVPPSVPANAMEAGLLEEVAMVAVGFMLSDRMNEIMRKIQRKEVQRRRFRAARAFDIREGGGDDIDIEMFGEVDFSPIMLTVTDE